MSDAHASHVAHQFESAEQQRQVSALGMWIFLVTEMMFFGGIFAAYSIYRSSYPDAWREGCRLLHVDLGGLNTVILMLSSFFMTLAVHSAQLGRKKGLVSFLVVTMLLGFVFLGIKAVEYHHKIHDHLVPGAHFVLDSVNAKHVELFLGFYFTMTGLHAVHMVIGLGVLIFILRKAVQNTYSADYYNPVEIFGLYWHFVDIVWIFLFPLLYLVGRY